MAIYEIDTLKQSLKKYTVTLALGMGIGLYLGSCTLSGTKQTKTTEQTPIHERETVRYERIPTPQEQRLAVFESYTRK